MRYADRDWVAFSGYATPMLAACIFSRPSVPESNMCEYKCARLHVLSSSRLAAGYDCDDDDDEVQQATATTTNMTFDND